MSYQSDVQNSIKNVLKQNRNAFRNSIREAGHEIIDNTQVKTGTAKGNWNSQKNVPNLDVNNNIDPGGTRVKGYVTAETSDIKLTDSFYLTNNTPYVGFLETGTVKMRAYPMVDPVISKWPSIVARNTRKNK